MRVSLGAISNPAADATCGPSPCTDWDYVWSSSDCDAYLACAGLPPLTFSGQLGAGVQSITGGAASVVGAGVVGATSNVTTDILLLAIAVGAVAFFMTFK